MSIESAYRILIVDDHPIVRQGLRRLIDQEEDLSVCGEAEDVKEARNAIEAMSPDAVILDISLRNSDGVDLIKELRLRRIKTPVLVLSMHDESIYAERLLSAGANGYIMKQEASDQFLVALRGVLAGDIYVSNAVRGKMVKAAAAEDAVADPISRLSNRELQVFNLIGQGLSTREIAEKLNLSVKTIESHRLTIKDKLNIDSATQLMRYAVRWTEGQTDP
ncbi:MAG: response regulator transcription factor [Gammaproteobacteria bacterium]